MPAIGVLLRLIERRAVIACCSCPAACITKPSEDSSVIRTPLWYGVSR
ncbi:Uncharacterised protein [Vibrio cholerae]|nr:Uncharacterised protein [Vibrio cholerae]CSI49895.1 Uncharacterised protein [Vibrio cholerae]